MNKVSRLILFKNLKFHYKWQFRFYTSRNILKLSERGLWHDQFPQPDPEFDKALKTNTVTGYAGFDPTADALHIGNLLVLVGLLHFQRAGHSVIALIGGATACIGDPSGRHSERPILDDEEIKANSNKIYAIINRIFHNHSDLFWKIEKEADRLPPLRVLNNSVWNEKLKVIHFLREVGKYMRMGTLLKRSAIHSRLEANEPLSYTEFSYQVLQAYDWLYLYRKFNCTVQIGGKDQYGNMACGYNLIHHIESKSVTGLTVPIVTNEAGDKFGKSGGECVWLDPKKTSPFDFYQYFLRQPDSQVEDLLKLFTFLPLQNIEHIMESHKKNPEKRNAQKTLAEKVTLLVHGDTGLKQAKRGTELLYGRNRAILADMDADELVNLFGESCVKSVLLEPGITILDMSLKAGCFKTSEDAERIIEAGGFRVNEDVIKSPSLILILGAHILPNNLTLLRVGKKNYYIVKWL